MDMMVDKKGTVMIDDIPFQKLTIWSDNPDEKSLEVIDTLIPPLGAAAETPVAEAPVADTAKSDDSTETHYEMLMEQELRIQR